MEQQTTYQVQGKHFWKTSNTDNGSKENHKNLVVNMEDSKTLNRSSRALPLLVPAIQIGLKVIGIGLQIAGIFQKINSDKKMQKNFEKVFEGIGRNYEAINRNYYAIKNVEAQVDRNFVVLVLVSELVNKTLSKIEQTRIEMHQEFNKVLTAIDNSRVEPTISKVNNFVQYFIGEKDRIRNLPQSDRISKLQEPNNILVYLKDSRTPRGDSLRTPLYDIIEQRYAVPKHAGDNTAFLALHALHYATQTYVSVMFFILEQYTYLANYYYNDNDLDEYNRYFTLIKTSFEDFRYSLVGSVSSKGLIDNVIDVVLSAKSTEFIVNEKEDLTELLEDRIKSLNEMKQQILKMTLPMLLDTPDKLTGKLYFTNPTINIPIGDWQNGKKVSYAVQYKSNDTYSKVAEWSTPSLVHGNANPYLRIPVDPERRTRLVFRKFDNETPQLVAVIEEKYKTEFRDIDRDLYNVASRSDESVALGEIDVLLRNGADVHKVFMQGRSAIHAAAEGGNSKIANKLLTLDNSTDINARDAKGYTPLFIAAEAAHDDFIKLLIRNGADVNIRTYSNNMTALHIATYKGYDSTINILMQKSKTVEVNAKDHEGFTPLHYAVFGGVPVLNALMLHNLADVNAKSTRGLTPLHLAAINNHHDVAEALLLNKELDINSRAEGNLTALHVASAVGNLEMVKFLINKNDTEVNARSIADWTPLHFAVSLQKENVALELINNNGTEIDLEAEGKITPLHLAATTGQNSVLLRILQRNALIEQNTNEGLTPLHLAAINGNRETISILLNHGAKIETKTCNGWTPLQLSVTSQNSNLSTIKHLIHNGANLNVIPNSGESFLHLAAKSGKLDIVKFFTDKNYNVNGIDKFGNTPLHLAAETGALDVVKHLMKKEANIRTRNRHNKTVLHFAVASGNVAVVKYLAENGCDVNLKDKDNNSPIYLAAENNHFGIVECLLEDQNVDFRSKNNAGKTVLHAAASLGDLDLVKYLVRKRADINAKDDTGLAALIFAARNGHLHVIKYFIEEKDINVNSVCNFVARPLAAYHGYLDIVKYLLDKEEGIIVPVNNMVSLASAAQNGHLEVVRFLLKEKLDFELDLNQIGVPVFLYASSKLLEQYLLAADLNSISKHYIHPFFLDHQLKVSYLILLASNNGHLAVVKHLIDTLTDVDFKSKTGTTILHVAAASGYSDTVKYLTEVKKADFCIEDNNNMTPLLYATRGDHLDIVKFLVEQGANLNSSSFEALLFAAENGNVKMAKYFIMKNADVNVKIKGGPVFNLTFSQSSFLPQTSIFYDDTPLSIAVKNNRLHMVKYLIEQQANVNASGENGRTTLHFAVQNDLKMTTYLLEKDADVNAKDKNGQSPLHFAVQNNLKITSYLIEKGGDVNAKDQSNCRILHNAAKYGHLDIVQYLVDKSKVDINVKDNANHSPAYNAASNGFLNIVKYLVDEKHAYFNLPSHDLTSLLDKAVKKHHPGLVRYLIQKGARPSVYTLHDAAKEGNLDIVMCLVEAGANVNARITGIFSWGLSPIHEAASYGHLDIVSYFADEKQVDINVKDNYNWTPLHYAANKGHFDVVKYLIDKKHADPNSKGTDGKTPLNCAAEYPSTFKYIAESGIDLHKACQGANSISCIEGAMNLDQMCLRTDYVHEVSNINESYSIGMLSPKQTVLQHAMRKRHYKAAEYLVLAGANVNAKNPGGFFLPNDFTALHVAAEDDDALSIAELLVKKGADINAMTDNNALTPLGVADICCNTAVANFLKSKGARRNRRSTDLLKITNNKYPAEVSSSSNKPFSWINAFAYAVKDTVMCVSHIICSPFKLSIRMGESQVKTVPITTANSNGALMLLDVFVRKTTGQKYISTVDPTETFLESMCYALRITDEFETIIQISAENSGISLDILNIDVVEMQKEITKIVISGKLNEITETLSVSIDQISHDTQGEVDRFLVEFEERMSEALDEIIQSMFNSPLEVNSTKDPQIFADANKM